MVSAVRTSRVGSTGAIPIATVCVAAVLLIASLLGPTWLYIAAQPAAQVPELFLSYSDLGTSTAQSPSALQAAYFDWLGWTLVILAIVIAAAAVAVRHRAIQATEIAVGLISLLLTLFAVKGPLSWDAFLDTVPDMRLGSYMIILGFLIVTVHGITGIRAASR